MSLKIPTNHLPDMRKSLKFLPVAVVALTISASLGSLASAKDDWDSEAARRKAEYIFLEAQSAYSESTYDKYLSMIDRAYALDSSDVDIAGEWALISLIDESTDSATAGRAYRMLQRRYVSNPANMINGRIFANIALQRKQYGDALRTWEMLDSIYPTRPEPALELAKAYLRTYVAGDSAAFDKAMAIYDRIETGTGKTMDLSSQKINAFYIKGDTAAVISELDSLYANAPKDSYTALFVGAHYQYLSKPDKAIKYFDIACELDPSNGPAYLSRAKFYNAQGDSAAFDREVFQALKSASLDAPTKIEILRSYVADLYTDRRQEARIKELFNTLQEQHSGEPQIHDLYASYLYELQDYEGAAEQFSYSAALDPSSEQTWISYVQMLAMAEDTLGVIDQATQAMHRFPQNLYFPILTSNMYRMLDDNTKAMAVLDSVDISQVNNELAVSNLLTSKGDLFAVMGDTVQALATYEKAIETYPDNKMAMNNAAYFMALTDTDLDKAERYSARSLQGDELNPTYLDTYAWVFFKKKDYKMAKQYIDIALNAYAVQAADTVVAVTDTISMPDDTVTPDNISAEIENSVEIEETEIPSADVYDHAGDIYFMNGEHTKAVEFWEKAHALEPEDETIAKKVKHRTIFFK